MKLRLKRTTHDEHVGRQRDVQHDSYRAPVFSYHASRSVADRNLGRSVPPEMAERQSKRLISLGRRVVWLAVALACVTFAASQISLTATPKVIVVPDGNSTVFLRSTATYVQAASKLFDQKFSERNKLTVNSNGIAQSLKEDFPELANVSITVPMIGNQPAVYIQPAQPSFVLAAGSGEFVLDMSGRAFASIEGPTTFGNLKLVTITDETGTKPHLGQAALPSSDVTFIQTVLAELAAQHFGVRQVVLPPAASEVDVYIAGKPYYVKFNMQDQAGVMQQAGAFIAVAQQLASQGTTPKTYIDVRLDGRAYYK